MLVSKQQIYLGSKAGSHINARFKVTVSVPDAFTYEPKEEESNGKATRKFRCNESMGVA